MGLSAKSDLRRTLQDRSGIALPSGLFALVALSLMMVGIVLVADLSAKSARNRERAGRALNISEAAAAHTLSLVKGSLKSISMQRLLRGNDSTTGTADDGLLIGYTALPTGGAISDTGVVISGGRYFVRITDDPADPTTDTMTDGNFRVLAKCRGLTTDSALSEVEIIIGTAQFPGVAADGDLKVSGNPQILGACGGAHANGNVDLSGSTTVAWQVSATGTVIGTPTLPAGGNAPELESQPNMNIPDLNPHDYCGGADYIMLPNGYVVRKNSSGVTIDSLNATSVERSGWKRSSDAPEIKWDVSSAADDGGGGTYCVSGNVVIGADLGTSGTPVPFTVLATGSISVSGNPYFKPDHADNIMMMAGGDLMFSGNPAGSSTSYSGLMYAENQCKINGNPVLSGQLVCKNKPHGGSTITNHSDLNEISGNPIIRFDCGPSIFNSQRILSWYPRYGA